MKINKKVGKLKDDGRKRDFSLGQSKFFVNLGKDKKILGAIKEKLKELNNKDYGKEISFKDLAIFAIRKLTQKDMEKIKEESLTEMEKVNRLLSEYNKKNNSSFELGEFLVRKLNIN